MSLAGLGFFHEGTITDGGAPVCCPMRTAVGLATSLVDDANGQDATPSRFRNAGLGDVEPAYLRDPSFRRQAAVLRGIAAGRRACTLSNSGSQPHPPGSANGKPRIMARSVIGRQKTLPISRPRPWNRGMLPCRSVWPPPCGCRMRAPLIVNAAASQAAWVAEVRTLQRAKVIKIPEIDVGVAYAMRHDGPGPDFNRGDNEPTYIPGLGGPLNQNLNFLYVAFMAACGWKSR